MNNQQEDKNWVDEEYGESHFEKLAVNVNEWTALYKCPQTGELWERYYPFPEGHGGGPARFIRISPENAGAEFDFSEE